jgi:N-hydroxyarylamine O-acetyltransferase
MSYSRWAAAPRTPETDPVNLDAYFRRIGYHDSREPVLDTLRALHACHVLAIPFENLSPFLGERVPLDVETLEDKLVRRGRGGYCYEHNLLFLHVLRALGFSVTGLAARVLRHAPPGMARPRTHMLLRVDFNRAHWIADVGYGNFTLTSPLELDSAAEQQTPHEPFRLVPVAGEYRLEVRLADGWTALYAFDLQEQTLSDYEPSNWYVSTHPQSQFVTDLIASRALRGRRITLRNNVLTVYPVDGEPVRRTLATAGELRQALESEFGLALGGMSGLDARLAEIARRPGPA